MRILERECECGEIYLVCPQGEANNPTVAAFAASKNLTLTDIDRCPNCGSTAEPEALTRDGEKPFIKHVRASEPPSWGRG